MPKITRRGGFTDGTVVSGHGYALLPGIAAVLKGESGPELEELPEGEPWVGTSSSISPAKPPKNDEPEKPSPRKRARTTGNPSATTTGSGSASSATTSTPATDG